jgi:heterodisulfide reductase subunit A
VSAAEPRIGVYVCQCGVNIGSVVDVEEVAKYAQSLPNVVVAKSYLYMCSAPGQEMITKDIVEHKLSRVVVAACSPRLHETTFRRTVSKAGLNPFLLDVANIREHCSWVHPSQPAKATAKAKDLVRMAVARARLLEPLEKRVVEAATKTMVIGGGVAGMRAAIDLAERGFEVYLVEKSPTLGGRMTQLGRVFPTDDYAEDLLQRMFQAINQNPNIRVLTNATVESVEGFVGNFGVNVSVRPRRVNTSCDACAECEPACPIEVPDEYNEGLSPRKAIYLPTPMAYRSRYVIDEKNCNLCGKCIAVCPKSAIDLSEAPAKFEAKVGTIIVATGFDPYEPQATEFGYQSSKRIITLPQFVRMLDERNAAPRKVDLDGTTARNIVFIGCVGSRQHRKGDDSPAESQKLNEYCSRVCCAASLYSEIELKKRYPQWNVFHLYRDIRTYGRNQEHLYEEASDSSVIFLRYDENDPPTVTPAGDKILVTIRDLLGGGQQFEIDADLVVLAVGMVPRESTKDLQLKLKVPSSPDGFIQEIHAKLRPVEVSTDGIFIAGTAQGPKDITESAIAGSAAAAKAASIVANGRVELEPTVAQVDQSKCDGCVLCIEVCSFKAISVIEASEGGEAKKRAIVNEAFCKGCGACAAICPPRAIGVRHFTLAQISAVVEAALAGS